MHGLWRRVIEILRPRRLDRETVDELSYPYEIVGVVGDLRFRGPRSQDY